MCLPTPPSWLSNSHSIFKLPFSWDQSRILGVFLFNLCDDININRSLDFDNGLLLIAHVKERRRRYLFFLNCCSDDIFVEIQSQ